MKTRVAIRVSRYVVREHGRREVRFRARFMGGPHHLVETRNSASPEEAIGTLIRYVMDGLDTREQILQFVASLFGDLTVRSPEVILARAVWFAADNTKRKCPGVEIDARGASRSGENPRGMSPGKNASCRCGLRHG